MLARRLLARTSGGALFHRRLATVAGGSSHYRKLYDASLKDPEAFWTEAGKEYVSWQRPFDDAVELNTTEGVLQFFSGGKLNVSTNCIDRHVFAGRGDKTAIIWEKDEPGETQRISFMTLMHEVSRLANVLKRSGVRRGDVVTLYMPMCPHAVYAMLACARIGAPHSVVFAGFSADALAQRIDDAGSKVVLTADEGVRAGKTIPLKKTTDAALAKCSRAHVETVLVYERTGAIGGPSAPMVGGRDLHMQAEMATERPVCPAETMDAEDTLFRLYTSGSTGTPKGMEHSTGGYLVYAAMTHRHIFDMQPGDVYACVADIGWITGHSYVVYGPLANGHSTLLFESVPNYPSPARYWEMVQRLGVTQLYTAPTALRALMKADPGFVTQYDRSSLRVLGTVGEPINPEAWRWYRDVVGEGRCTIVDTWWQTETCGVMMTPLPGDADAKPGAAMRPFFGVDPVLLTPEGHEIEGNDVSGPCLLRQPRRTWNVHCTLLPRSRA